MKDSYKVALVIILISIALGTVAGLLVQENQPPDQHFIVAARAFSTQDPVSCPGLVQNSNDWLKILVLGNRTGINFISTEIISQGQAQLNLPLNETAYAYYKTTNSTVEEIDVPLAGYFSYGESLEVSVNYFISDYPPTTFNIGKVPITGSNFTC